MTDTPLTQSLEYARANQARLLEKFYEFLRIPSVSTDAAYQPDVHRAAEWLVAELERLGFDECAALPTDGHPVVYGEWLKAGDDQPTVIIYAHYDVQPPDPLALWQTPPFEPELRDGKLYARGAIDDKAGVWGNLIVFEALLQTTGALPFNVKVFFEGEEESGSPSMAPFITANRERLAADLLIISDGGCLPPTPEIIYSARGIISAEVTVTGPEHDFHSGLGGGVLHNPVHMVAKIIASFHDDNGHIRIPGAYDGSIPMTEAERQKFAATEDRTIQMIKQSLGDFRVWGEPGFGFMERSARTSLDVNGVYGGYQGDGVKTIIPAKAGFKVTMRLAPGQDPHDIARKLEAHVMGFACDTVDIAVKIGKQAGWGVLMLQDGPIIDALDRAYQAGWGQAIDFTRTGGSIPIMGMFQRELNLPITVMGFGSGALAHAPNEHLLLDYFQRNIDTAIHFYHALPQAISG
ncbi:MAG: dipeptidase [Chloroflexi bacterium]|nr:dipeptidase [Chloroflexota bacterium]